VHLRHRDPDWQSDGIHAYYQCRCGARRVRRVNARMSGPVERGWPQLTDRHGLPVFDTGWRQARTP
jgi:hypothetical protein